MDFKACFPQFSDEEGPGYGIMNASELIATATNSSSCIPEDGWSVCNNLRLWIVSTETAIDFRLILLFIFAIAAWLFVVIYLCIAVKSYRLALKDNNSKVAFEESVEFLAKWIGTVTTVCTLVYLITQSFWAIEKRSIGFSVWDWWIRGLVFASMFVILPTLVALYSVSWVMMAHGGQGDSQCMKYLSELGGSVVSMGASFGFAALLLSFTATVYKVQAGGCYLNSSERIAEKNMNENKYVMDHFIVAVDIVIPLAVVAIVQGCLQAMFLAAQLSEIFFTGTNYSGSVNSQVKFVV